MKPPSSRQRWLVIGALLAGTIAAAFLVEDDPVAPAERQRPAKNQAGQRPPAAERLAQAPAIAEAALAGAVGETVPDTPDPFRSMSWYVAPPPPPPPRPTAPPLPFLYLGQLIEEDGTRIFVSHQGRHLILKAGDVVAGTYAVEEVDSGKVVFLYLPLKERQVLPTGSS